MHPLQRERGALVMVKKGGPPFVRIMAFGALRRSSITGELVVMRVFVATLALFRRRPEVHVVHGRLHVGGPKATYTGHRAVGSQQRESGR